MKKVFCVLFFFGIIYTINAQSWVSSNIISGNDDISVIKATVLSDNSTIVYGYFTNTIETSSGLSLTSYGSRDYFVAKFNHQNQVDWLKQFGNTGLDYIGGGIAASNNDTIFITGGFQNTLNYPGGGTLVSTGGFDIFFAKMDSDGNVLWCNNIGKGIPHQRPNALQLDENGDVLITGFFTDSIQIDESTTFYSNDGVDDYFINKFNPITGELSWAKQISALNNTLSGRIFETATFTNSYAFVGMYTDSIAFYNLDTIVSANNSPDIHILNTDLNGNINWIRSIKGDNLEYDYAIAADETGDIYVAGYYQSPSLTIDINETETTTVTGNNGDYDFFVAKYSAAGIFQWIKTNGSTGTDKILRMNYFNDEIQVIGLFSDTVQWGGIELTSKGPADQDMFYGSLDLNGNYRSASNYGGRNNSVEEGREIFNKSGELSTVIRSNSDLLILGDSIYLNPAKTYLVAVGTIGCLPINYDYVNETDITACYGDETGAISIGASGGFGGPYQYSNDDGDTYQSNSNFTSLPAGTYNITVKDAENCVESGPEVILTQPTEIAITSVDSSDVLCNGDNSGSINVAATGGTGTIFYSVDNGTTYPSSVGTPTAVTAGVYDVIVKDANNCEMTGPQITIEEPVALTIGSVEQTNVLCNGASTGELIVHASGGTKPYQFSIDDGATYKTDSTFSGLTAGTYTPYVTDANGCLLIGDDITITEPVAVTVTTAHENVQCNGESNGSITITATGDTGPYNFSIDGATYQVESIFGGLSAGTYTIDVEDANGCSWTASDVTITQPDVLSITSAVATDILCSGETNGTITVTAAGGTTPYQYSVDDGVTYQSEALFTSLAADTYPVRVKDANGCEIGGTNATISEPEALTILGVDPVNLTFHDDNSGSIFISVAGGVKPYEFAVDGAYQSDSLFEGLAADVYNPAVLDANGCPVTATAVTLTEPDAITISSVDKTDILCNGATTGELTINAENGVEPYEYSIDNGTTYQPEAIFPDLGAGVYPIDVRDANGCAVSSADKEITQPEALAVSFTKEDVLCNGKNNGRITVTATGGTAPYLYSIDGGALFRTTSTFYFLAPGTYNIHVRDANGCISDELQATITEPEALLIDAIDVNDLLCYNEGVGDLTINVSGGSQPYAYSLNGATYQTSNHFADLAVGTYPVSVVDVKGCEVSSEATVTQPDSLIIDTIYRADISCFDAADGMIAIAAAGGTETYEYSIDDGLSYWTDSLFNDLVPGIYPVRVRDFNGCLTAENQLTLTQPELLLIDSVEYDNVACNGDNTGWITVYPTGGTEPYQYSTDGGVTLQADSAFTGLTADTYTVTVVDANGCTIATELITITEPEALAITSADATDVTCNGVDDGTITIAATGGTTPYEYTIDGSTYGASEAFSGLAPGSYTAGTRDANGCETGTAVTITEPDTLTIAVTTVTNITDGGPGEIVVTAGGGTVPYTYTLAPGDVSQDNGTYTFSDPGDAGDYTVSVVDAAGCGPVTTDPITISDLTSVELLENGIREYNIYPNPSGGMVTITFQTEKAEMVMEMCSVEGKVLMNKQVFSAGGKVHETLDLSDLAKGVYMIRIDNVTLPSGVILK